MSGKANIKIELVKITPDMAEMMIEKQNKHNRAISERKVDQYARDMKRGEWITNGEAIKISGTNLILDGQHRLLAIINSGKTIEMLIITGLPEKAQESMDQGRMRTFNDMLKLRGEGDYHNLAAITRIIYSFQTCGVPIAGWAGITPSNQQLSTTLKNNNSDIHKSLAFSNQTKRKWIPISTVGALHMLFSSVDEADANAFFTGLLVGENLDRTSPIYVLRERLINEYHFASERRMHLRTKVVFIIKAWNAWKQGTPMTKLMWNGGGSNPEHFPKIEGLQ